MQQPNHQQSVPTITEKDGADPELLPPERLTPQEACSFFVTTKDALLTRAASVVSTTDVSVISRSLFTMSVDHS